MPQRNPFASEDAHSIKVWDSLASNQGLDQQLKIGYTGQGFDLKGAGVMQNELLSTREAAAILNISQETVSRLIKKGKLEGQKLGGFFVVTRASVEFYALTTTGKSKNDPTRKLSNKP